MNRTSHSISSAAINTNSNNGARNDLARDFRRGKAEAVEHGNRVLAGAGPHRGGHRVAQPQRSLGQPDQGDHREHRQRQIRRNTAQDPPDVALHHPRDHRNQEQAEQDEPADPRRDRVRGPRRAGEPAGVEPR